MKDKQVESANAKQAATTDASPAARGELDTARRTSPPRLLDKFPAVASRAPAGRQSDFTDPRAGPATRAVQAARSSARARVAGVDAAEPRSRAHDGAARGTDRAADGNTDGTARGAHEPDRSLGLPGIESGAVPSNGRQRSWREWLAGGSSREVLARIVPEDPLGIRAHVAGALVDGCYLLDGQRVALRCFALVARHAVRYRGRPELEEWLALMAREAVAAILRDDGIAETRAIVPGREPGREHGEAFAALAKPLGLEPEAMGRACLAFNRNPEAERAAFFALVIRGRSLDELVRERGESATEIARRARRALDTILASANTGTSDTKKGR